MDGLGSLGYDRLVAVQQEGRHRRWPRSVASAWTKPSGYRFEEHSSGPDITGWLTEAELPQRYRRISAVHRLFDDASPIRRIRDVLAVGKVLGRAPGMPLPGWYDPTPPGAARWPLTGMRAATGLDLLAPSDALLAAMLQIGELAQLTGVTPRTIRHYHHTGLLPEPTRNANGYRTYGARALSRLVQIRRLSALGLSLAEIADALDSGSGSDMQEVLRELDADLAARQAEIQQRRTVIAGLLEHGDDPTLSPDLAEAIRGLGLPADEVDALRAAEFALPEAVEPYRAGTVTSDPASRELGELVADLADAAADDPRVEGTAHRMYSILSGIAATAEPPADDSMPPPEVFRFGRMMMADYSPGQRRAWELALTEALEEQERAARQPD